MKDLKRFYTSPLTDKDNYAVVRTLVEAVANATKARRVLLVTQQMQQTEFIESLIGNALSGKLPTQFPGLKINSVHKALHNVDSIEQEAFVALGLSSDELLAVEDKIKSKFMIVAPWNPGGVEKWAKITGATLAPENTTLSPYPQIDCLLEQALTSVKLIGNDVSHVSDRGLVKTVFTVVFENNIPTDRNQIEAFLFVKFGWTKSKIDKILVFYDTLKSGGQIKGELLPSRSTLYGGWKAACE